MANVCGTPLHLCRIRVTALDAVGNVQSGADNSYVSDKGVQLSWTPETRAGETRRLEGGCDCTIASFRTSDRLERFTLELTHGAMEPALFALMIGATVMEDGSDQIGFDWPDQSSCAFSEELVAIEAWGDLIVDDAPDATRPYIYALFSASSWTPGQQTMQNDFSPYVFNGVTRSNTQWGDGPYGGAGLPDTPGTRGGVYQTATEPPAASCAVATVAPSS